MIKFIKDKRGISTYLWFVLIFIIIGMYVAFQVSNTVMINERAKIYAMADEAANKAAQEIYQYQKDTLSKEGQVDQDALDKGLIIAEDVFKSHGFTLLNPQIMLDKGYLVVKGDIVTPYKKPVISGGTDNIVFHIEGRSILKKLN
jgi:hypothetical protein